MKKRQQSQVSESDEDQVTKKNVTANRLEQFIEDSDLTQVSIDCRISKDEDVCVLEVPKDIDPANFIGKLVNFDRETKVKINKKKYVIEPCMENLKPIALLTNKLKIIKPVANLKLCEYKKT
jgi:hypothetical protein